jgi:hypothetical protein
LIDGDALPMAPSGGAGAVARSHSPPPSNSRATVESWVWPKEPCGLPPPPPALVREVLREEMASFGIADANKLVYSTDKRRERHRVRIRVRATVRVRVKVRVRVRVRGRVRVSNAMLTLL